MSDPLATDESLEDLNHLTDLVGPELAGMVSNPSVAQPVKHVPTSVANSTSNSASDMPPDISDLRSQDLLSTLSGVGVDIDRMFEEVSKTLLVTGVDILQKKPKNDQGGINSAQTEFPESLKKVFLLPRNEEIMMFFKV